jgi:hypothetical protein
MTDQKPEVKTSWKGFVGGLALIMSVVLALAVVGGVVRRLLLWGWT